MQIALISDIHANFEALSLLTEPLDAAEQIICLGDLVGYYCQVNEVLDFVRERKALCILGNHDYFLLKGCPTNVPAAVRFGIEYADQVIRPEHRDWLATLPLVWGGMLDGRSFLLAHGSPWRPIEDYLYADNPALEGLRAFDFDVVAFGQTHRPLWRSERRPYLLNPGSVGQSRHAPARVCMALLETETMNVTMLERPYDPAQVIEQAKQAGAGNWVEKHLL